jgi:ABC-type transporter Mla MlaB component
MSTWRLGSAYGAAFLSRQWYPDRLNTCTSARCRYPSGSGSISPPISVLSSGRISNGTAPRVMIGPQFRARVWSTDLEVRDRRAVLHQSGKVSIVLNLKDVGHIDSTGLGTWVFGLAKLRKASGRLALVNLNRGHLELFLLTKLAIADYKMR